MNSSVLSSLGHLVIDATPPSRAVDVFAQLLLPGRFADQGYRSTRAPAEVTTLLSTSECPIGPLHYSSSTNVLMCYTVRYESGSLGAMIISGASALPLLLDDQIRKNQRHLFSQWYLHGPVQEHTLTEVRTPRAIGDLAVGAFSFWDFSRMVESLSAGAAEHAPALSQPLRLNSIKVRHIGLGDFPVCSFFTTSDSSDLMLSVSRSARSYDKNPINITRPEQTLGNHLYYIL